MLPLRDKVVEFETQKDFEKALEEIATAYDKAELGEDAPLMKIVLSSISAIPFPKKMETVKYTDGTVISVGNPTEQPNVLELQHFIDMDVRGHILGILWIMTFGKRLDDLCLENVRGNRLRSKLIRNEDGFVSDSSTLFVPYFAQYSLWRDEALTCAEKILAKGCDALILTLDLKNFYNCAGITEEVFIEILKNDCDNDKALHSAVFAIIKHYSVILQKNQ
jgi:hypothetical protein